MPAIQFMRTNILEPLAVTVDDEATPLWAGVQDRDAHWVCLQVRSMGTASWVAWGNLQAQEARFLGVGDFQIIDVPPNFVFNAANLRLKADVAGQAVVEVSGMFPAIAGNSATRSTE
jgi:hypothetical protein